MKTDNVLESMAAIVEKKVELYKTDFYKYDIEQINRDCPHEFAWFVRETGTHLMTDKEAERIGGDIWLHGYEIFKRVNEWFYIVKMNEDGSGEITLSEKRCDEFAKRMSNKVKVERKAA